MLDAAEDSFAARIAGRVQIVEPIQVVEELKDQLPAELAAVVAAEADCGRRVLREIWLMGVLQVKWCYT